MINDPLNTFSYELKKPNFLSVLKESDRKCQIFAVLRKFFNEKHWKGYTSHSFKISKNPQKFFG